MHSRPHFPTWLNFPKRSHAAAWIFGTVLVLSMNAQAWAGGLEAWKKAGGLDVSIRMDRNPPVIGENRLEIALRDGSGKMVTDASVLVNYYMPPMPRMAPMNYRIKAPLKGETYRAVLNFIMEGPWIIVLKISRSGNTATARFNVDAR